MWSRRKVRIVLFRIALVELGEIPDFTKNE